jgi:hypothetical protein
LRALSKLAKCLTKVFAKHKFVLLQTFFEGLIHVGQWDTTEHGMNRYRTLCDVTQNHQTASALRGGSE